MSKTIKTTWHGASATRAKRYDPFYQCLQVQGLRARVARLDNIPVNGVADGGFKVVDLSGLKLTELLADVRFPCSQLATEGEEGRSQHVSDLVSLLALQALDPLQEVGHALKRGNRDREVGLVGGFSHRVPEMLQGRNNDCGLGTEEIIEAAFLDVGPRADIIESDGMEAFLPQQLARGVQESLAWIAGAFHDETMLQFDFLRAKTVSAVNIVAALVEQPASRHCKNSTEFRPRAF